ncbi:MAG: leucyl aminopeptidase family protein [Gammaproteobacteria bacterium]|nr:leucyl aminopeptidase family protein [Gammaproteobacteria bacterium]
MRLAFTSENAKQKSIPVYPIIAAELATWVAAQPRHIQQWMKTSQFLADSGAFCLIPNSDGSLHGVALGIASADDFWAFGALPAKLPEGNYIIADTATLKTTAHFQQAALGWGLGFYQFSKYKIAQPRLAKLVLSTAINEKELNDYLDAIYLARDLINTPAEDMGPDSIEKAVKTAAKSFSATVSVIKGDSLLKENYIPIHTVGRASHREPRVIDLRWNNIKAHKPSLCAGAKSIRKITLVGKGVCFDSGGLDLKNASGMLLMKKDMAGSAMMLALAQLIMSHNLPVQLRLLIGAVDNAVSANAYRPGDIMKTRSGKTVEITNTDAEGRLVLCDLLTEACSETPDLVIDFATLTGAARVALGEDIPAFYAQPQSLADDLMKSSRKVSDPIWQLPLVQSHREKLKSEIADMINCVEGSPYGGSITAALFLQSFVTENTNWAHFDTCAWNFKLKPGHPVGGEVFAVRAVFDYIKSTIAQ